MNIDQLRLSRARAVLEAVRDARTLLRQVTRAMAWPVREHGRAVSKVDKAVKRFGVVIEDDPDLLSISEPTYRTSFANELHGAVRSADGDLETIENEALDRVVDLEARTKRKRRKKRRR
jgi:hypothetical protein